MTQTPRGTDKQTSLVCAAHNSLSYVQLMYNIKGAIVLWNKAIIDVQVNLIITLSLGSIETDRVISEPCNNEVTLYRDIVIWEP